MWEMETALTRDFCCRKHYLWLEYLPSDAAYYCATASYFSDP